MSNRKKPSQNEAQELEDLVNRIDDLLVDFVHVSDYIPNGLYTALEKMQSYNIENNK